MQQYLEAGKVVTTHGVRGEMKLELWCDGVDFLKKTGRLYASAKGGKCYNIASIRPQGQMALLQLEGVNDMDAARALRGQVFYFDRNDATLPGCIRYSFIGYFYSGITPSGTGGQPAQLYEMCKDGNNASDSTVVLMVVALFYKLVLVVIGLMLPVVWLGHMREYLGSWLGLYVVGIVLNVVLVALLCGVMFSPGLILNIMCGVLAAGERCGIVKNGEKLRQDAAAFAGRYRETTHFLREHKGELVVIGAVTFLQRSTVFLITGMVYLGFGLSGSSLFHILAVQAAVYIAVDMLPVPGAQGITELMYAAVFGGVFGAQYVKASMVLVRGMDFYVPFCVSMLIVLAGHGVSYVRRQRKRA